MANDRKLKSLSELRSLMTAENKDPEKSVVLGTAENAESLYQQAKQKLAKGDTSEGVRSLEAVKHVPSLSDEFKQIVQERITASERKGIDKETESLRSAIRQRGSGSASILDLFRLHHRLDRPQRVLQTTGIQGVSTIGVYRWSGDNQSNQLWSSLIRAAKKGDMEPLRLFGLALFEHWRLDPACKPWHEVVDMVVPVPANPVRQAERNVDIAGHLAERLARLAGLPLHCDLLKRNEGERAKNSSKQNLRLQYIRRDGVARLISGRTILLIDDVVTTGRTVQICAELLRDAGAREIFVLAIAQAESSLVEKKHLGESHTVDVARLVPWLCLSGTPDLGPVRVRALIEQFKTPEKILSIDGNMLEAVRGIGPKLSKAIVIQAAKRGEYPETAARLIAVADRLPGGRILTLADSDYPAILGQSNHAVPVLYGAGLSADSLGSGRTIAIVGSRTPIPQVREATKKLARELSDNGWVVISGLAEGCDALAHEGALAGKSQTWAFLGCGVDQIYPPSNRALRDQIIQRGWLFSEYPFGTRVAQDFLRKRNNLIAGAASAVVIIQTALDGGTMNTAKSALAQRRPLFCFIPPTMDLAFSGNRHLLVENTAQPLDSDKAFYQLMAAIGRREGEGTALA